MNKLDTARLKRLTSNLGELNLLAVTLDKSGYDSGVRVYSVNPSLGIRGLTSLSREQFTEFEAAPCTTEGAIKRKDLLTSISMILEFDINQNQGKSTPRLLLDYMTTTAMKVKTHECEMRIKDSSTVHIYLFDWFTEHGLPVIVPAISSSNSAPTALEILDLQDQIVGTVTKTNKSLKPSNNGIITLDLIKKIASKETSTKPSSIQ